MTPAGSGHRRRPRGGVRAGRASGAARRGRPRGTRLQRHGRPGAAVDLTQLDAQPAASSGGDQPARRRVRVDARPRDDPRGRRSRPPALVVDARASVFWTADGPPPLRAARSAVRRRCGTRSPWRRGRGRHRGRRHRPHRRAARRRAVAEPTSVTRWRCRSAPTTACSRCSSVLRRHAGRGRTTRDDLRRSRRWRGRPTRDRRTRSCTRRRTAALRDRRAHRAVEPAPRSMLRLPAELERSIRFGEPFARRAGRPRRLQGGQRHVRPSGR